jgi:hypothetical protein
MTKFENSLGGQWEKFWLENSLRQKESVQRTEHGESLKFWIAVCM